MMKKALFLFVIFSMYGFSIIGQNHLLNGRWEFIPEHSTHIDLFGKLELEINATTDDISIVRIWGTGSRIYRDTLNLIDRKRKQTEIINSRVFPTNVFMGIKIPEGQKREFRLDWDPKELRIAITESFPGLISQGEKEFVVNHVLELEPVRNILSYKIIRSTRHDAPIEYLFKKEGQYDACFIEFDSNWDINQGLNEKAAIITLQGLANKDNPNFYVVYPESWDFRFTPGVKDFLNKQHYFTFKELRNLEESVKEFREHIQGYIVWDTEVRSTLVVSYTLSGLKDAIVIDENMIPLMDKYDIPRVEDFRGMFTGWTDAKIYEWAKSRYWKDCSKDYIVWMGGDAGKRMRPGVADWGIKNKAFFSDLSTKESDVEEFYLSKELLSEMNDMGMVFGWHSYAKDKERDHVSLTSSFGLRVEGLHTLPNMSFMNHIEATPGFVFKNNHSIDPKRKYIPENKVYISCIQTDCLGLGAWTRPGRGDIPYAWEVTMNWIWLAPAMMEFFYSQATPNDYFIGSLSGPGYMYPKAIPEEKMKPLLKEAERLMEILDLNIFEIMDYSQGATIEGNTEIPKEIVKQYRQYMPEVLGFVNGYAPAFTFGETKGTPFISYDYYLSPDRPLDEAVADIRELADWNDVRPYYCLIHVRQWSDISRVKSIINELGEDFELVPLDELMMYIKQKNTYTERYQEKK
jgi:hypothetical protein